MLIILNSVLKILTILSQDIWGFFSCRLSTSTLVFTDKLVECFSLSHLLQMALKYELLPEFAFFFVRASLVKRKLTK